MTEIKASINDEIGDEPSLERWTAIDFNALGIKTVDSVELLSSLFSDTPITEEPYCGFTAYRGNVDGEDVLVGYKNHRGNIIPGAPELGAPPTDMLSIGPDFYCRVTHEHLG